MARIHYTTPEGATGEIELTAETMSVGRADDNAIVIADASVSSHHGEFVFDGADWFFNDLGSTNGTKVQGELVTQISLSQNPSFTLGSVDCVYLADGGDDSGASYSAASSAAAPSLDGYGALPYDRSLRTGFGPKVKEKQGGTGLLLFGVLGLIACGVAVFLFSSMAA